MTSLVLPGASHQLYYRREGAEHNVTVTTVSYSNCLHNAVVTGHAEIPSVCAFITVPSRRARPVRRVSSRRAAAHLRSTSYSVSRGLSCPLLELLWLHEDTSVLAFVYKFVVRSHWGGVAPARQDESSAAQGTRDGSMDRREATYCD